MKTLLIILLIVAVVFLIFLEYNRVYAQIENPTIEIIPQSRFDLTTKPTVNFLQQSNGELIITTDGSRYNPLSAVGCSFPMRFLEEKPSPVRQTLFGSYIIPGSIDPPITKIGYDGSRINEAMPSIYQTTQRINNVDVVSKNLTIYQLAYGLFDQIQMTSGTYTYTYDLTKVKAQEIKFVLFFYEPDVNSIMPQFSYELLDTDDIILYNETATLTNTGAVEVDLHPQWSRANKLKITFVDSDRSTFHKLWHGLKIIPSGVQSNIPTMDIRTNLDDLYIQYNLGDEMTLRRISGNNITDTMNVTTMWNWNTLPGIWTITNAYYANTNLPKATKISEYAGIDQYMVAPAFEGKTGSRDFFDYIGWYTNHVIEAKQIAIIELSGYIGAYYAWQYPKTFRATPTTDSVVIGYLPQIERQGNTNLEKHQFFIGTYGFIRSDELNKFKCSFYAWDPKNGIKKWDYSTYTGFSATGVGSTPAVPYTQGNLRCIPIVNCPSDNRPTIPDENESIRKIPFNVDDDIDLDKLKPTNPKDDPSYYEHRSLSTFERTATQLNLNFRNVVNNPISSCVFESQLEGGKDLKKIKLGDVQYYPISGDGTWYRQVNVEYYNVDPKDTITIKCTLDQIYNPTGATFNNRDVPDKYYRQIDWTEYHTHTHQLYNKF